MEPMKPASVAQMESALYLGHINNRCSYLPERQANLLYLHGGISAGDYRRLLDYGYRRSGAGLYRTDCDGCRECQILRIPLAGFRQTKSQSRVWRRGQGEFRFELTEPSFHPRKLRMYERYLLYQHHTRESDLNEESYVSFFVSTFLGDRTRELDLFVGDRLAGLGILDVLSDSISSVYFFFDPEFARLSPGTYSMLLELELARQMGLVYHYPGYYITRCAAMNYKGNYGPAEIRMQGDAGFVPFATSDPGM